MPHALEPGVTLYLEVAVDAEEFEEVIGSYLSGPWPVEVTFMAPHSLSDCDDVSCEKRHLTPDEDVKTATNPARRRMSSSVTRVREQWPPDDVTGVAVEVPLD